MAYQPPQPVRLRNSMVEEWTDERHLGHGWFCLLKEGWTYDPWDDLREQSFETKRDALGSLVYPVQTSADVTGSAGA